MKTKQQVMKSWIINLAAIVLLYALLLFAMETGLISRYLRGILMTIFINIILAASLNLTTGFLGQIALGHAGFMSIGAYTAALFVKYIESTGVVLLDGGSPTLQGQLFFLLSLLAGGLLAAVFGLLVGIPALRLKGDYLAIITLGFGEIIRSVVTNLSFTGGAGGLKKIEKASTFTIVFIVAAITVVIISNLVKSRHGRAICAIRDNVIAAESAGINVVYYKLLAFTVAAFFAGVAGVLYGHNLGILKPDTFDFNKSIEILVIVVLGGMGNIRGSIIAAALLTILPEALREFADFRMLAYAIVLIIVMLATNNPTMQQFFAAVMEKVRGTFRELFQKSGETVKGGGDHE